VDGRRVFLRPIWIWQARSIRRAIGSSVCRGVVSVWRAGRKPLVSSSNSEDGHDGEMELSSFGDWSGEKRGKIAWLMRWAWWQAMVCFLLLICINQNTLRYSMQFSPTQQILGTVAILSSPLFKWCKKCTRINQRQTQQCTICHISSLPCRKSRTSHPQPLRRSSLSIPPRTKRTQETTRHPMDSTILQWPSWISQMVRLRRRLISHSRRTNNPSTGNL
jgi:hypothetical protein